MCLTFAYITTGSVQEARDIGEHLVRERLAACVNILPTMHSLYHWQGGIAENQEVVLIAKTRTALFEALTARVQALHSDDTPCVLELPVGRGSARYIDWLMAETASTASLATGTDAATPDTTTQE